MHSDSPEIREHKSNTALIAHKLSIQFYKKTGEAKIIMDNDNDDDCDDEDALRRASRTLKGWSSNMV